MTQNVWEDIVKNACFVENSNFIRRSTEAPVRKCSSNNSQKNTRSGILL